MEITLGNKTVQKKALQSRRAAMSLGCEVEGRANGSWRQELAEIAGKGRLHYIVLRCAMNGAGIDTREINRTIGVGYEPQTRHYLGIPGKEGVKCLAEGLLGICVWYSEVVGKSDGTGMFDDAGFMCYLGMRRQSLGEFSREDSDSCCKRIAQGLDSMGNAPQPQVEELLKKGGLLPLCAMGLMKYAGTEDVLWACTPEIVKLQLEVVGIGGHNYREKIGNRFEWAAKAVNAQKGKNCGWVNRHCALLLGVLNPGEAWPDARKPKALKEWARGEAWEAIKTHIGRRALEQLLASNPAALGRKICPVHEELDVGKVQEFLEGVGMSLVEKGEMQGGDVGEAVETAVGAMLEKAQGGKSMSEKEMDRRAYGEARKINPQELLRDYLETAEGGDED